MRNNLWLSCLSAVSLLSACGDSNHVPEVTLPASARNVVAIAPPAEAHDAAIAVPVAAPTPTPAPAPAAPVAQTYATALAHGKQLAAQGDAIGARAELEAAARLDKRAAAPHIELARIAIAHNERAAAIADANKAVKLAPDSSLAWNTLGRAELARFGYDAAVDAFAHATELEPKNAWAWNNLGFAQLEQKHYAEAVAALEQATALPAVTGYMWNNLGTAYEQLGELDLARAAFANGGKLGSAPAIASRKRLMGVVAIVAVHGEPAETVIDEDGKAGDASAKAGSDASAKAGSDAAPKAGTETAPPPPTSI